MKLKKLATLLLSACVLFSAVAEAGTLTPYSGTRPGFKKQTRKPVPKPVNIKQDKSAEQTSDVAQNSSLGNSNGMWRKENTASDAYVMNIGLANGISVASVCMTTQYNVVDMATGKVLTTLNGNIVANIAPAGAGLSINNSPINSQSVRLQPVTALSTNLVKYNGASYRGTIVVKRSGSKILVVNAVPLEDYLLGTVPAEMTPAWPQSALEAQSVAARTFALYSKNQHKSEGYNLCNSTHCQVYEGIRNESGSTTAAVNATRGYVMLYEGKPIYAPFHSSSGGMTENCEDVWGNYMPYLRSVTDDDSQSPFHQWSVKYTVAEVEKKLSSKGHNIGHLKNIQLMPNASTNAGKSTSGRSNSVKFIGTSGEAVLTGVQLRTTLGLKSTMFTIRIQRNTANTKINNGRVTNKATGAAPTALQTTGTDGEMVIIDGHGFGHGLGMSQWGAKAMAEKGKNWQSILNHYYTGVEIKKLY